MASSPPALATSRFSAKFPSAVLEHLADTPRLARVTAASHLEIRPAPETASSGIVPLDALTGGLPRGCLTEITGPDSSGRTSVLLAALAAATQRGEICALIDASDAFHPHSGAAAGIDLTRLLWVRCTPTPPARSHRGNTTRNANSDTSPRNANFNPNSNTRTRRKNSPRDSGAAPSENALDVWKRRQMEDPVEQALRATDLILQSGGFGMVAIDLAGVPVKTARRIPLTTWFRFRRVIEPTPTVLLLVSEQPCAQTCATLGLRMAGQDSAFDHHSESSVGGRRAAAKKPPAFSSQLSAVSSEESAFGSQLSVISSKPSAFCQPGASEPTASESRQRRQILAPHVSAGDGTPPIFHVHLFEGLPIRAELLRAPTGRKPAQSVAAHFPSKAAWTG